MVSDDYRRDAIILGACLLKLSLSAARDVPWVAVCVFLMGVLFSASGIIVIGHGLSQW